jgi:hypothetical protein
VGRCGRNLGFEGGYLRGEGGCEIVEGGLMGGEGGGANIVG